MPQKKGAIDFIRTVLTTIGVFCFLQYFIFGIYGIFAGHSIQTDITRNISLWGAFLTIFSKKYRNLFLCLILFNNVWIGLLNIHAEFFIPNKYVEKGKIFYNQEQYENALKYFKKASETYTCYFRFFNVSKYNQVESLLWISKTYIKTGKLDKAEDVYYFAILQYPRSNMYIKPFEKLKEDVNNPSGI